MRKNSFSRTGKSVRSVIAGVLLSVALVGCGSNKLTERSFDMAMSGHHVKAVVQQDKEKNNIKFWKYASTDTASCKLQYIELTSESAAKKFVDDQRKFISDNYGTMALNGGNYTVTTGGFYYFITRIGDRVVIASSETKDSDELKEMLNKMPEISVK